MGSMTTLCNGAKMSIPIRYCSLVIAVDDLDFFGKVHPQMKRNLDKGHFSILPCEHDPPCRDLSDYELDQLFKRFREPIT